MGARTATTPYWRHWKGKSIIVQIAKCGIRKPHANNNRIELNGTLREGTNVQRTWKKHASSIAEGQKIQYNYVKPHQTLENQTPAQRAEIEIK
jgi:putative transposase